jgi:hypothetical protein
LLKAFGVAAVVQVPDSEDEEGDEEGEEEEVVVEWLVGGGVVGAGRVCGGI